VTKDKLDSFKIGDSHRPGLSKPAERGGSGQPGSEESFSMGFARIEGMLEKEDPVAVGESLNELLAALQQLSETGKNNKEKLAAKKAMIAVERTVDLIDYLFQTKAAMEAGLEP